jgi:hypothetical protein
MECEVEGNVHITQIEKRREWLEMVGNGGICIGGQNRL